MRVIIVTGTPGTGKTTISKFICKKFNYKYIDVNRLIKKHNLRDGYDKKRRCYIIDEKKLCRILIKEINNQKNSATKQNFCGIVIDSHLSHYLPKEYVELCIVVKCNLKTLEQRLKKRRYNKGKIRDNIDCEIFDICYHEAVEIGHKVLIVDTPRA